MAIYQIDETIACYVTWRYEIEANSEAEARELYMEGVNSGQGWKELDGPFIGDAIEYVPQTLDIKEVQP